MAKEILIADSDKADQKEFQRIFETTGYHLIFSESGEDALLRAKLFKPDMIIASGGGLQEKGGLELCGAIKGDPDFRQIPFILISSIFDEISEKDRRQIRADGVISKPLNENEVLDLVSNLMEEGAVGKREEMTSEKQEFLSNEAGEEEEEIIELVDVVGEPEPRMSIDSFVPTGRERSIGDVSPLDSWGKMDFEEKPIEKESELLPEKRVGGMDLRVKRKVPLKEAPPEDELFDKIELEEILEKVEELKPSLEKEWPFEKKGKGMEKRPSQVEEPVDKLDLSGFEAMLRKEAKAAQTRAEPQPFRFEEPEEKILEEAVPREEPSAEPAEESLEKPQVEPVEEFLEESLKEPAEESLEEILEEPIEESLEESLEEPVEESLEGLVEESLEEPVEESLEESLEEPLQVEELKELDEEEFPEELLEDILEEEEIGAVAEAEESKPEEEGPVQAKAEELGIIDEIEKIERMEKIEETEEIRQAEQLDVIEEMKEIQEAEAMRVDRLEEEGVLRVPEKEVPSLAIAMSEQVQEVISQKVQEMMGEMMTKLVPEMTRNVVGMTLERIEKLVKEVVPDLAEKAIQEEIKRLQKGEKE